MGHHSKPATAIDRSANMLIYLVSLFLLVSYAYSQIIPAVNLGEYSCSVDNTQKCTELEATASNLGISTLCNTDLGFCSINCSEDADACQSPLLALVGISDLSCSTSTDCTFSGFGTCASTGTCIPDTTNECSSITDCTTDGLQNCETQTLNSISVDICSPERCDVNTPCETSSYLCVDDYCTAPCRGNADCDIGFNNTVSIPGLESPTPTPTAPQDPSVAVRCGAISVMVVMAINVV